MQKYNIPLAQPYFNDDDILAVKKVIESRWVAQGPTTILFEKEFAKVMGSKYAVALNSATSGLHIGLLALNIKKGDDVLVSDFTFPASGNSILYAGAKPIPVDVDINTYNINSNDIEKKITSKTRAIMPVYALGNPPDMDEIIKISKEHKLAIIEDSACAHGSRYKSKMAGTFGKIGVFSFHARKVLSTGEGGMAITNDKKIYNKLKSLRSHGMNASAWERNKVERLVLPKFSRIGYNYRMSDITAAIGRVQLKRLNQYLKKRWTLVKIYNDLIEDYHLSLIPQKIIFNAKHNYQTYAVRAESKKIRNKLIIELKKKGIGSTVGTYSLSKLPLFKGVAPNSIVLFETTIALPMHNYLKSDDVRNIIKNMKKILS